MKSKKKTIIIITIISVISLALLGILIYGIVQDNSAINKASDNNTLEEITPSDSIQDTNKAEETVPPITPDKSTDKTDITEKADIEFDINNYKPEIKKPFVESVTIESGTKEK